MKNDTRTFTGLIDAVRGGVVEVRFSGGLPPLRSVLRAGDVVLEVSDHAAEDRVRCIALTPTAGLARGQAAVGDGSPLTAPVGQELLGRMFNVFGQAIDGLGEYLPWGVDVATGVESADHRKDPARITAFIEAVQKAESG